MTLKTLHRKPVFAAIRNIHIGEFVANLREPGSIVRQRPTAIPICGAVQKKAGYEHIVHNPLFLFGWGTGI